MAKADIRKAEMTDWRVEIGRAIQQAMSLRGASLKEFATAIDRDESQLARWIGGAERPQLDTLFTVDEFRQPVIVTLAELGATAVRFVIGKGSS